MGSRRNQHQNTLTPRLQGGHRACINIFRGSDGVHGGQQAKSLVELDQGRGAVFVRFQAGGDRVRPIVLAVVQQSATIIALALDFGRAPGNMENRMAFLAHAAAAETRDNFGQWHFVVHDGVERKSLFFHESGQLFSLDQGARKSVKQKACGATNAVIPLQNHFPHGGIGDEVALLHVFLCLRHGR